MEHKQNQANQDKLHKYLQKEIATKDKLDEEVKMLDEKTH